MKKKKIKKKKNKKNRSGLHATEGQKIKETRKEEKKYIRSLRKLLPFYDAASLPP
jgi:hypothetical protein